MKLLSWSFIFLILVLMVVALYFFLDFKNYTTKFNLSLGHVSDITTSGKVLKKSITKENIIFAGDLMLARDVERKINIYGDDYPFTYLKPLFSSSTYVVVNFENSVPKIHKPTKDMGFSFSVNEDILPILGVNGITHVALSNNHTYDFGSLNFKNTLTKLKENSLVSFGNPYTLSTSSMSFLQVNEKNIAIIALNFISSNYTDTNLTSLFKQADNSTDYQIVFVHWGNEYKLKHGTKQEKIAKKLIKLGADLIIGHHPHVVQDIQNIDGVPVFYSLGNLVFDQYFNNDVQKGLLLSVFFDNGLYVDLIPVSSLDSRIAPRFMSGYEKDVFLKNLAKKSDKTLSEMIITGRVTF